MSFMDFKYMVLPVLTPATPPIKKEVIRHETERYINR